MYFIYIVFWQPIHGNAIVTIIIPIKVLLLLSEQPDYGMATLDHFTGWFKINLTLFH